MKKFFKKIISFFGVTYNKLKKNSDLAVRITNELKKYVENPFVDVAVNITPWAMDNAILITLRKVIPQVAYKVAIAHRILHESANPNEAVGNIITELRNFTKDTKKAFWVQFAAELNIALNDGKISFAEAVILTQMVYIEFYDK